MTYVYHDGGRAAAGYKGYAGDCVVRALTIANTTRLDLWAVLDAAPAEVAGLRTALIDGRVNGSVYQGECACLVGTIANVKGCAYSELPGLTPDADRPAERWFMPVRVGDKPVELAVREGQYRARVALRWIDEWQSRSEGTTA